MRKNNEHSFGQGLNAGCLVGLLFLFFFLVSQQILHSVPPPPPRQVCFRVLCVKTMMHCMYVNVHTYVYIHMCVSRWRVGANVLETPPDFFCFSV